jgi:oligopeptide/dipeptide ABC transporter ATP-binding protein
MAVSPPARTASVEPLLTVANLTTVFPHETTTVTVVRDVSFHINPGETLGLVGESGSGKSITAFSIMRLLQPPGRVAAGRVVFRGRDLLALSEHDMERVRGADIGLVFQEPMSALDPVMRVGAHIAEALTVHGLATRREARGRAIDLLRAVRIPDADRRIDDYPHQLSGGMRQRVMIAIAIACRPALVIADEPTTALDVTVQAQILDLLRERRDELGLSLLLITHDLGVIAETADRVAVMYAGRIVEEGPVRAIFHDPLHPYTRGLLASIPGQTTGDRLSAIDGTVPAPGALPPGCAFAPRCPARMPVCDTMPGPTVVGADRQVRCHLHGPAVEGVAASTGATAAHREPR